jgi:nitroimidazol reductase NimA-like FMN-containing flavoprotein (pyridoxamine 5'-phosphate oxidase superfamily)
MVALTPAQAKFVESQDVMRVATSAGGVPHVVPVNPLYDPKTGAVCFVTDYKTKKLKNVEANPNVALVLDTWKKTGNKGLLVVGKATVLHKGEEYMRLRAMLYKRFPAYHSPHLTFGEGEAPFICVAPEKVVSWGV